jgi:PilZ domain
MQPERPRARRYAFVSDIQLINVQSDATVLEQTSDLSLFGCHVHTLKPFAVGTRVRIRIAHRGSIFAALGRVANARADGSMGVIFTRIEQNDQLILEKWLNELRE